MKKARRHDGTERRREREPRRPRRAFAGIGCRAFTLIEALVAVGVLLVIILFTSTIFSSVSNVTTAGQANADLMQDAAAIEIQIRQDFERLSREGFFIIICRAVRNDINDPTRSGVNPGTDPRFWLDPNRDAIEYIRSDRLVFFTQGVATGQHYDAVPQQGANRKAQSNVSRVYYGHGFQLGDSVPAAADLTGQVDFPPWDTGDNGTIQWADANGTPGETRGFFQPPAPKWTLARQAVLLGDDGGGTNVYLLQGRSTRDIWNPDIRNSRADFAASLLNDIRRTILTDTSGPAGMPRVWNLTNGQRDLMIQTVMYPRAEAVGLTQSGIDLDKTLHVLGTAVSDFAIDWTYEAGTGLTPDPNNPGGPPYRGVQIGYAGQTPWFGLPDQAFGVIPPEQDRGVFMVGDEAAWRIDPRGPVFPLQIEFLTQDYYDDLPGSSDPLDIWYIATFGYNEMRPLDPETGRPWATSGPPSANTYTPWPSALRITMRVHDPRTQLENGRIMQFVVNLPKRNK